jgi:acylglycerol lipase
MKHFESRWKSKDNLNLYAQGWEPQQNPVKAVVCLVHGLGEHTSRYSRMAAALTNEGFALMGADLRGHGRSEGKKGHFPSIELVMQDLDVLLEQARKRYPRIPLFLFGFSLGGILVLHYGLIRKPRIKGIIASGSGLHTALEKQPGKIFLAKLLGGIFPAVSISSGLNVDELSRNKEVVQDYKKDPLVQHTVTLGFGKIMIAVNKWTREHAHEFSLPLLLMHGKADELAFSSGSSDFAKRAGEKCTLVLWDDAKHELHNEPEQDEVFKTMLSWMHEKIVRGGEENKPKHQTTPKNIS